MARTRLPAIALLLAASVGLAACTAVAPAPEATPRPSSPATTPEPSPSPIVTPDAAAPDQIAIALVEPDTDIPTTPLISGPAILDAGMQVRISSQCRGTTLGWRLQTASTELEEQRVLAEGTTDCDGSIAESAVGPVEYSGPVQFLLTRADGVDEGWVQARQVALQ